MQPPPFPPPTPPAAALFSNLGNNSSLSFLPSLDKNDENDNPPFPTNKYQLNLDKGIAFTQTEPLNLITACTQNSIPKINLLVKVGGIKIRLEVEEIIPRNEEKLTFLKN